MSTQDNFDLRMRFGVLDCIPDDVLNRSSNLVGTSRGSTGLKRSNANDARSSPGFEVSVNSNLLQQSGEINFRLSQTRVGAAVDSRECKELGDRSSREVEFLKA